MASVAVSEPKPIERKEPGFGEAGIVITISSLVYKLHYILYIAGIRVGAEVDHKKGKVESEPKLLSALQHCY